MNKYDEWAMKRMCENLNLDVSFDAYRMAYIFRKKIDPDDVINQLEYCFGDFEGELCLGVHNIRRMDTIELYKRLTEVFEP
jgi:hypothetical protein